MTSAKSRLAAVLVAPAGIAVAAVLLVLRLHFQPVTVPAYAIVDAAPGRVVSLAHGGRFEIEAAPSLEVQGAVTARAFLVRVTSWDGGAPPRPEVLPWKVPLEIVRDGSAHLAGPVDALFAGVPRGEWEVVLVVGRPELLPNDPRELLRGGVVDGGSAAFSLVRERVMLME